MHLTNPNETATVETRDRLEYQAALESIAAWVDWEAVEEGADYVRLDGKFTVEQLEALASMTRYRRELP
jgi:hypothetical protein